MIIKIGEYIEHNITYEICDTWSVSQSGYQGMTIDNWDISMIPAGAVFELSFEMYDNPDKLFIEYPLGNMVLDTGEKDKAGIGVAFIRNVLSLSYSLSFEGWRGNQSYAGPLFPGGIESPGTDEINDIFPRLTQHDKFVATIIGPGKGTEWNYKVRCHSPYASAQSSGIGGDENELAGYGWSDNVTESNLTEVKRYNIRRHRIPLTSGYGRDTRKRHLRKLL